MAGVEAFIPQIWNAQILRTLENNLIAMQICNTDYEGEIKEAGDTVHFSGLIDPSVNTYSGSITYEDLMSSDVPLLIDQQKYFAFKVKDVEKAQSKADLKNSQATRAAYKLKNACDAYILGLYAQAGLTGVTDATVDTATVLGDVAKLSQRLEEVNVADGDKVIVLPPWMKTKLQLAGVKFQIANGIKGQTGLQWTNDLGFDLYISNNLHETGSADAHVTSVIGCSRNAIAFAEQIVETRAMPLEDSFAIGVSGLHVYGAKVIKPNEMVVGTFTEVAEAAI